MSSEPLTVEIPKLPQLSEEDVKAVRSFLPGKLLGRTAAFLALMALLLGFSRLAGWEIQPIFGGSLPLWGYGVLVGLALLAVVAQVVSEWLAERTRQAKQLLAVKAGIEQTGYFRIGPYQDTMADRAKFSRPDRAEEKALEWIKKANQLPIYFTGDSGSGKSSLLNAYLLPKLREEGWTIVEAPAWQDPLRAMREALQKLSTSRRTKAVKDQKLAEIIEEAAKRAPKRLLIVLDQFEEFLILASPEQQREFTAFIADVQSSPVKQAWLLLVLRSDYQMLLEEISLPALRSDENLFQLARFRVSAATEFINKSGLDLQPEALATLLTSATELDDTPGLVRPITLNVVGFVLASGAPIASTLNSGTLVRNYIVQTVQQPALRDGAPRVLEQMVTEQGTKQPRSEDNLAAAAKLQKAEVRAILNGLSDAGLARPLDPVRGVWELSHDFIAHAVVRFLARRQRLQFRLALAYAAPALLAIALLGGVGFALWEQFSPRWIQADLQQFYRVSTQYLPNGGIGAIATAEVDDKALPEIISKLARLGDVQILSLTDSKITNLEPLKGLVDLQFLDIHGTKVEDLEPLKGLTRLWNLNLAGTKAANLEPLRNLTGLWVLNLTGTKVANLEPLKGLTNLQDLNIQFTEVADLGPLKAITALRALNLWATRVADLGPLKGLKKLQTLDLAATKVVNLEPLKELTKLDALSFSGSRVTDLEPLRGLTGLRTLQFQGTNVTDLEPLKRLTDVQTLNLWGSTQITDLQPLKGLSALRQLDLTNTKVTDLKPLKGLSSLQWLGLAGTEVINLEPLEGLSSLQTLNLAGTNVADLDPLKALTNLQALSLEGTKVVDLEPLKGLAALQTLDLAGTKIANLEPLKGLTNLQTLSLWGTEVTNLEPLRGLTGLRVLNLAATKVTNFEPIYDLPNIRFK